MKTVFPLLGMPKENVDRKMFLFFVMKPVDFQIEFRDKYLNPNYYL